MADKKIEISNGSPAITILKALEGHLVDRIPAVHACAAHSLSDSHHILELLDADLSTSDDVNNTNTWMVKDSFCDAVANIAPGLSLVLQKQASGDKRATVRRAVISAWFGLITTTKSDGKD
eukprot:11995587-Ditylum_brightwellii.AAC.1